MIVSGVSPWEEMKTKAFHWRWESSQSRVEFDKRVIQTPSLQEMLGPCPAPLHAGLRIISILASLQPHDIPLSLMLIIISPHQDILGTLGSYVRVR